MKQDVIERTCEMCPTDISHLSKRAKVCSERCRNKRTTQRFREGTRASRQVLCVICNEPIPTTRRSNAKTCSSECGEVLEEKTRRKGVLNRAPKRGFITWRPQAKTRRILSQVGEILIEYEAYLPMSVRQIFYRLVGAYAYAKDEASYNHLSGYLANARRAGFIDPAAIRDDGIIISTPHEWESPENIMWNLKREALNYRCKRMSYQEQDIRIWCEAGGMVPQIAALVDEFGIPVQSSGGNDSVTAKIDAATAIASSLRQYSDIALGRSRSERT